MSSVRREAFISKVLARLYPEKVSTLTTAKSAGVHSETGTILKPTSESCVEFGQPPTACPSGFESKEEQQEEHDRSVVTDPNPGKSRVSVAEKCSISQKKIYTVSLPPDDYVPGIQRDVRSSPTENSDESEDEEDKPLEKRKRRRRRKKVNVGTAPDNETRLQQTEQPSQTSESGPINKNKKRKLQRKRQKERLKAAGLWTKAKAVKVVFKTDDGFVKNDANEVPDEEQQRKAKDLVEFLQATYEIYSTESKSTCADSELSSELIVEILDQIKNAAVTFSEVQSLHHLKRLLLLQDIERLKCALDSFKEHSSMPFETVFLKVNVNMFYCYRRITPGYIRLLQSQTARKIVVNGTDILMGRASFLLGVVGIWISTYSAQQMIK